MKLKMLSKVKLKKFKFCLRICSGNTNTLKGVTCLKKSSKKTTGNSMNLYYFTAILSFVLSNLVHLLLTLLDVFEVCGLAISIKVNECHHCMFSQHNFFLHFFTVQSSQMLVLVTIKMSLRKRSLK